MPLTKKGEIIKDKMTEEYGPEKGEQVFYASRNKGTIKGVDKERKVKNPGRTGMYSRYSEMKKEMPK